MEHNKSMNGADTMRKQTQRPASECCGISSAKFRARLGLYSGCVCLFESGCGWWRHRPHNVARVCAGVYPERECGGETAPDVNVLGVSSIHRLGCVRAASLSCCLSESEPEHEANAESIGVSIVVYVTACALRWHFVGGRVCRMFPVWARMTKEYK